jgi:AcrR family transcriptional regulator
MEKFNKTDKQEIILSAAEKLFALHGFDGTTTRMLASEANVNIAMLSYYYGSKEQLFKALLESRAANFYSKLQEAKGSSPILIDKVVALSGVYVDRIFENNLFHRIIQRELSIMKRSDFSDGIAKTLLQNAFLLKKP